MRVWLLATLLALGIAGSLPAQTQPLLQLQGQPYFGGSMKLHLTGTAGQPALLAYGLNPLPPDQPIQTGKGPWYIGGLVNLIAIGNIPASGRIDLPFSMPPLTPGLAGIPIVMQGYVPNLLTNATTLPLDYPNNVPASATILESPIPTNAGSFSDRIATGDFNGDGEMDIAVGAWFEDAGGVDFSGRAYIFWGPTMTSITTLQPPVPTYHANFGLGLAADDFDNDGIDDLIVAEGTTDPPPPNAPGVLHLFHGGNPFSTVAAQAIVSAGTGAAYSLFGRAMTAADYNADGYVDIAVGLPIATVQGLANAGKIELYWGPNFGAMATLQAPDLAVSGFLGDNLATGDVNGDGIKDLLVGAPRKKLNGLIAMGRVYVFVGPDMAHYLTIDHPLPSNSNSRFGNAVVGHDCDGDGDDDVVATDQRNHAFVFSSPDCSNYSVLTRPPDPSTGTAISVSFGYFAAVGDVNHDGAVDVIVGEPFSERVYAALGPYWSNFHVLVDKMTEPIAEFGWGVNCCDIDGDGQGEVIVGSDLGDSAGVSGAGRVTIYDYDQ